jgi:hypothetical protein
VRRDRPKGSSRSERGTPTVRGTTLSIVASLVPANSSLNGISAASAKDIWAVGQVGKATFTEHINGTTWSVVPRANPTTARVDSNNLLAVTVPPGGGVVAVGLQFDGSDRSLIVQS